MSDKTIARRVLVASSALVNRIGYTAFDAVIKNQNPIFCEFGMALPEADTAKLAEPYSYSPIPAGPFMSVNRPVAYLHDFRRSTDGVYALISPVEGCTNKTLLKALNGSEQTFAFAPRVTLTKEKWKKAASVRMNPGLRDYHQIVTFDLIWK